MDLSNLCSHWIEDMSQFCLRPLSMYSYYIDKCQMQVRASGLINQETLPRWLLGVYKQRMFGQPKLTIDKQVMK